MPIHLRKSLLKTRWASFENPQALKGQGGQANNGRKGRPFESIAPGETKTLLDIRGNGTIRRIWMTVNDRSPQTLRSLRLDIYWDGATTPAVSSPLGDFFCLGLRRGVPFENELFSDPEGRSFNCFVPMPFRLGAKILLTNESTRPMQHLFYDVDLTLDDGHADDTLYFHSHWRRERPTTLLRDFEILPRVEGAGHFLGCNIGVITDPIYQDAWWGEGEVKIYLDGDAQWPTLCGTGAEDYIGTAWGQGAYAHRFQGCLLADDNRQWAFYRLHVPDPVIFERDCRVTIQQIGGWWEARLKQVQAAGGKMFPIATNGIEFTELSDSETTWRNFYREDDWSANAYFYLDRPENNLPPLADLATRTAGLLEDLNSASRADG